MGEDEEGNGKRLDAHGEQIFYNTGIVLQNCTSETYNVINQCYPNNLN